MAAGVSLSISKGLRLPTIPNIRIDGNFESPYTRNRCNCLWVNSLTAAHRGWGSIVIPSADDQYEKGKTMGRSTGHARFWTLTVLTLLTSLCPAARADIYQWLASPTYGTGTDHAAWYLQSTTLCLEGLGHNAVPWTALDNYLAQAYLVGANLYSAKLHSTNLTNAAMVNANLTNADFDAACLTGADFTGATIKGALLGQATLHGFTKEQLYSTASYAGGDLSGTSLYENDLSSWNFAGKNLSNADFWRATLTDADLTNANLSSVNFSDATLTSAHLANANLFEANLSSAMLTNADLANASLSGVRFMRTTLTAASLRRANLSNASFEDAALDNADLANANLSGVGFRSTVLTAASLANADLSNAIICDTWLANANFANANLTGVIIEGSVLTGADFSGAIIAKMRLATTEGFTKEQLYSTASYASGDLQGINLNWMDLSGWNFAGKDLSNTNCDGVTVTNASFANANLTNSDWNMLAPSGADFSGAIITGAKFCSSLTREQLYSTASYVNGDLSRLNLTYSDLSGWNLAGKNLSNADFSRTTLTGTNLANANLSGVYFWAATLTGVDLRGAQGFSTSGVSALCNVIMPDGKVNGLNLSTINNTLIIRNHDSIPMSFQNSAAMAGGATLQFVFDGNEWHAPATFGTDVTPAFGDGTLEILWSSEASFQLDEPMELTLFQWGDVPAAARQFSDVRLINAPAGVYLDASRLYTDGTVSLIPEPATMSLLAVGALMLARRRR